MKLAERGIHRPVKIVWTREELIVGHHKRHPYYLKARWGAKKDGKLVAAEVEVLADGGAYIYTSPKVLGNATLMCTGPYEIPNVKVDTYAVYTNNIPNGAFRGFGGPQGAFEAESQMNKLAEKLGMDPVEIRMRNIVHTGSILSVGTPMPGRVSMPEVVEAAAEAAKWKNEKEGWTRPEGLAGMLRKPHLREGLDLDVHLRILAFHSEPPNNVPPELNCVVIPKLKKPFFTIPPRMLDRASILPCARWQPMLWEFHSRR